MTNRFFFISTNLIWSGSEVLWYEYANRILKSNGEVAFAVLYNHPKIDQLKAEAHNFLNLKQRFSLAIGKRVLNKIKGLRNVKSYHPPVDNLETLINDFRPDLVIISQGNDFGSLEIMGLCARLKVKFVMISQLVAELQWGLIDPKSHPLALELYRASARNFFVSKQNLALHEYMLGEPMPNNDVIWNPAIVSTGEVQYPEATDVYRIAFVGRTECLHKGLDMLIEILSNKKWRERPIEINIYGDGPHILWLQKIIKTRGLHFIQYKGHASDISSVWKYNHIMILPSRMEGQALALLEAIACGRTAIVTDVGGASEIFEDNVSGFIANSISVEGIDEAMERAWSKREQWKEMGRLAKANLQANRPKDAIEFFHQKIEELIS